MKFDFCIGNPPYQDDKSNERLYPYFYKAGIDIAGCVEMIFPNAWRSAKNSNGLSVLNNAKVKKDKQIVFIKDEHNVFSNVPGAEWTNIILWKKGFDNLLLGKQKVIDERGNVFFEELPIDKSDVKKPELIVSVVNKVNKLGEPKVYSLVSSSKPYGFRSDPLDNPAKYGLTMHDNYFDGSVRLYGLKSGKGRCSFYIDRALLPKESPLLDSYKLFVVKAWGNMDEKKGYLGGSYSDVILANPLDCCSEMYLEVGPFASKLETFNAKKYFYTKFFRAVFYMNKFSQNTAKETYAFVPLQDFTDQSDIDWSKSVHEIDLQLYQKYGLSKEEIKFIEDKIKPMD